VGPNADSCYALLGDYTYQTLNEFFRRNRVDPTDPRLVTLRDGLESRFAQAGTGVTLRYERGCDWNLPEAEGDLPKEGAGDARTWKSSTAPMEPPVPTDADRAVQVASECDVIIAAMGENRYLCGEGRDRADVRLPGEQEAFVKRLIATGKPVVLILFGGRPMILTDLEQGCGAIIYAWYPGQEGGHAVADMILGKFNPSAKLTITLPKTQKQIPVSHRLGYCRDNMPLYPFGHGLSYTTFGYANLTAPGSVSTGELEIPITFDLTNAGEREGVEIAQLYVVPTDRHPHQPAMELKGFARVALKPGETKKVTITLPLEQFARHDEQGNLSILPGSHTILIGASSTEIRLQSLLTILGEKVGFKLRERFFSSTRIG
jgi:beta-glucosidase